MAQLDRNAQALLGAYRRVVKAVETKQDIAPAEEWFLDNYHIVDEQLREVRQHLPRHYYHRLPKLSEGQHLQGYPRVYSLVWGYVAHTDSNVEASTFRDFVRAYQNVEPLNLGELWAIPIHLRFALLENLLRLASRVAVARDASMTADVIADLMLSRDARKLATGQAMLSRLDATPLADAFVVRFVQRFRDRDPSTTPALQWLEAKLATDGISSLEVVAREHQEQAAANESVRHIITSMRSMSSIDWFSLVESVCLLDEALGSSYPFERLDFATRDEYRHQIEKLAIRSDLPEIDIARAASHLAAAAGVAEAHAANPSDRSDLQAHDDPGYYLLGAGRRQLEARIGYRAPVLLRLHRIFDRYAIAGYITGITVLAAAQLAILSMLTYQLGTNLWLVAVLAVLAATPASESSKAIIQRIVAVLLPPKRIPKLDLAKGIPPTLRTLVAVPTLLTDAGDVARQLDQLEVHFLANSKGHLHYALISDFTDAATEHTDTDGEILTALADGVRRLNATHSRLPSGGDRFLMLHRQRRFNPSQGCWMGWERKRGKLHELNQLLRGATDTTFIHGDSAPVVPSDVRYVITLDADTRVPNGAAYRLVGAMAHPMNRAVFDTQRGFVVGGYGILQPRITPTLPVTATNTMYQRTTSGGGGLDPYAAAVSDVYQDLVEQGSYTGKGIYDIDAFEAALDGKVADNSLLSHDLFEGSFARSGLVSDIELFEEFPSNYLVDAQRRHRWVRGDWQLLPWIFGHANNRQGQRARYQMPAPARWKMLDNLRRSLVAPASFVLVVAAVSAPVPAALWWLVVVAGAVGVPSLIPVIDGLRVQRRTTTRSHLRAVRRDIATALAHLAIWFVTLAHQTQLMMDAVLRTLVRCYFTRRRLLEWTSAAHTHHGIDLRPLTFYRHMSWSVVLAGLAILLAVAFDPASWQVGALLLVPWIAAPFIAARISTPPRAQRVRSVSDADRQQLRLIGRRTWSYFTTFVTSERNDLPPDNFQESPDAVVANRTSPTNIGLSLLSTTVAYDFGWIGLTALTEQLERTLDTIDALPKHRGHLLNWYDTDNLKPLEPLYVSTVDSGNLAGHLWALAQACRDVARQPVFGDRIFDGIRDTVLLALEDARTHGTPVRSHTVTATDFHEVAESILALLDTSTTDRQERETLLAELATAADQLVDVADTLSADRTPADPDHVMIWPTAVADCVATHRRDLHTGATDPADAAHRALVERLEIVAQRAEALVDAMDFRFLYNDSDKLLSIGLRVADQTLDPSSYDLLASESRLASFVAIAKSDLPPQHWFALGRTMTPVGRSAALLSWSGSMFEYLMPSLVMREPPDSLLNTTATNIVRRQISYGAQRGVPWGVSESAHNVRDVELTYQYSDFGVPGLGLRRGLGADVVVAPYATALAAMVDVDAALDNFRRFDRLGSRGSYGYYEAIDFTPGNVPTGQRFALVRAYMAHHQGMSLVALGNVIHGRATQRRFHSHPLVRATELLMEERAPRTVALAQPRAQDVASIPRVRDLVAPTLRRFGSPHDITPRSHLLSNGRYSVMLTAAGSGYSTWGSLALTRWREDPTRDCWGSYIFLRDVDNGRVWSAGFQPTATEFDDYSVVYTEDRARIGQRDRNLETQLEVIVSPHYDAELRRVSITNHSSKPRYIDLTSYAEVVLNTAGADEAHPAFSNLFVQTEWVPHVGALLATRRPRAADEETVWLAHLLTPSAPSDHPVQFETDRARFIGRGRALGTAWSIYDGNPLSNTVGTVLDPIVSLRQRVTVPPGRTVSAVFTTLVATSRAEAIEMAQAFQQPGAFERESGLAWTHAQVQLHHLSVTHDEAHLYQRLANRLIYSDATLRAPPEVLAANRLGQRGLWPHGISGDLPILLVHLEREQDRDAVRQLLHAHEYWRLKGLDADLVVLNSTGATYAAGVHEALEGMVRSTQLAEGHQGRGKVYLLRDERLSREDREVLRASARVEIRPAAGSVSQHVARTIELASEQFDKPTEKARPTYPRTRASRPTLEMFNGIGGFDGDGKEYVVVLGPGQVTPSPWINVIANPDFGFQASALGSGYTWSENSRENKLTPWSNDPVTDPPGEVLYVRDEDSGDVWTPTASPIRDDNADYIVRHGQGYTTFTLASHGIGLDLVQFVPPNDRVKISKLRIDNQSNGPRRLSVTAYVEWVLGVSRSVSAPHVVTEHDEQTDAIFASNAWNGEFAGRTAFFDLGGTQTSWTADRLEFLGRNASVAAPASQQLGGHLSGRTGAGLDPCAALRTEFELAPGQSIEVVCFIGEALSTSDARMLIERYRMTDLDELLEDVTQQWDDVLGKIQVRTPERSMDLLLNRWLGYQTLSCRIWARSGFYQSGGAYGFRDQLQDMLAITHSRPDLVRAHLLRAASRQFVEGDVQHWWHAPTGRGVRTRISDDRVWLVYGVTNYLRSTSDTNVLDEQVAWLNGPPLDEGAEDAYFEPTVTLDTDTLYEHCARALERTLETGHHGLPLIGGGDWNDGMNRVGHQGRGESVWLAWFLIRNLLDFAPVAESRGDIERADRWRTSAEAIRHAAETNAWDGQWYRRAFFDDRTPLGSRVNDECQIDAIPQSWAVISGVADNDRASLAMASSLRRLKITDEQLMLLFAPPFDRTYLDPGYIKGYAPGLRENGGQYTHAATWSVIASAMLGDGDEAVDLFNLINPIEHTSNRATLNRYKGEPYVMAADVYSQVPHAGRAGWTWYSGAAGWMYRAGIEWILGITKHGDGLLINPCIPTTWPGFEATYQHAHSVYRIVVTNPKGVCQGVTSLRLDNQHLAADAVVPLTDDGDDHLIEVVLG
ncbi:MAG: glucoamylase family protein [Nitriliruptoraceae bacterium]